jgi:hypothetical protein
METKSIRTLAVGLALVAFGISGLPDAEADIGSETPLGVPAIARGGVAYNMSSGYAFGQWVNGGVFADPGGRVVGVGDAAPSGTFTGFGPARIGGGPPLFPPVGSGVPSDFNNNGVVDAADYVLWRNNGPLPFYNDATFGLQPEDYDAWCANFGNSINPADTTTVAFLGTYDDPPKSGIFAKRGGQLATIAKVGDVVPSTTSTIEGLGSDLAISETTVAFGASYASGTQGILTGSGGALTTIAKTGEMTSVGPLTNISFSPAISGNTVAFAATVGDGTTKGIFTGSGGSLTTIFMTGDPAPVGVFNDFDGAISMGTSKVAFRATYDGGSKTGIFTGDGGKLTAVAQTGDDVPGVGIINSLSTLSMSGNEVAFYATWSGGEGFLSRRGAGPVELIARKTDLVPSGVPGVQCCSMGRFGFDGNRVAYSYFVPQHAPYRISVVGGHSPEPTTLTMLGFAIACIAGCARWRKSRTAANAAIGAHAQSESNRSWLEKTLLCAGLFVSLVVVRPVQADLVHASAYLGSTGVTDVYGLPYNYLGSRFSINSVFEVESVGGHIGSTSGYRGDLFAAIVSLDGPIALPSGSPFDSSTVASTVFTAPNPSEDILVPLSATLNPGHYALIFGSGQFGADGNGGMPTNNVDFPGRASYFQWRQDTSEWEAYNGGGLRFLVMGNVAPGPTPAPLYQATLLHPIEFRNTNVVRNSEDSQIGRGFEYPNYHALLWHGTAESVVDLTPAGFRQSEVSAVDENSQVGYAFDYSPMSAHAYLWHGTAESAVDLHPSQFLTSSATGNWGNSQVGFGGSPGWNSHALLWRGTADSVIDLHPAEFRFSEARALLENSQVGSGWTNDGVGHALLWHGTAESVVDLHPAEFQSSDARAISENSQVGSGWSNDGVGHALLWHGTAESVVDLHPAGYSSSSADFISGDTQIGSGTTLEDQSHALLWHGTAESVVDLHPLGYEESGVNDVSGNYQVGYATGSNTRHAMLWNGTAASAIDLHQYLPVPGAIRSEASGIAANGDIVGSFDYRRGQNVDSFAVLWKRAVEPLPGDYDGNGVVDACDYAVWRNALGLRGSVLAADGNGNGEIDNGDYDVWRAHFGQSDAATITATSPDSEAIPEPATWLLAALASVAVLCLATRQQSLRRTALFSVQTSDEISFMKR